MYVLDTNTLIYFFKGLGNIAENLLSTPPNEIGIPSIVLYELEYGIAKSTSPKKRREQLSEMRSYVTVLTFGEEEARESGKVRALLEKKGKPIGPYDVLIAGTTIAQQGILVTNNLNEFARVPGLKTSDWYE